jgi:UDP-2-acetamido-3-amino-2,3-dideoxy-glucuronate N-acetyltransferase
MIHALSNVLSKNIGPNTEVWQFCVILPEAIVGDNCNICSHVFIENKVIIGNNVTIKNGVQIWDGITIEDNVFIGPNVTFTNELVPRSKVYSLENLKKTIIKKGATIGANSTILPGIVIGEYAFIGAGSVVTKDVVPFSLLYGNPATQRGFITAEGIILDMEKKDANGIEHKLKT